MSTSPNRPLRRRRRLSAPRTLRAQEAAAFTRLDALVAGAVALEAIAYEAREARLRSREGDTALEGLMAMQINHLVEVFNDREPIEPH